MGEYNDKQLYLNFNDSSINYELVRAILEAKLPKLEQDLRALENAGRITRDTLNLTFDI